MDKKDIIAIVGDETGLNRIQARKAVESFMKAVRDSLKDDQEIFLRGFGTFKNVVRRQRTARNIKAGTYINVPAHKEPIFKPCKSFKDEIKK